jgi:predicted nucleotide-binding protein
MAYASFPNISIEEALVVAQTLRDESAGAPMNRLLVADALGIKPGSSNYRYLLSASRQYGLTEGTEKAIDISLTPLGTKLTKSSGAARIEQIRVAVMQVELFRAFFERFNGNKMPSPPMMSKILVADFKVQPERAESAVRLIGENGAATGFIRQISGADHVIVQGAALDSPAGQDDGTEDSAEEVDQRDDKPNILDSAPDQGDDQQDDSPPAPETKAPKAIFLGHGKKTGPLEKLEKILAGFQIPYKVAVGEPNLGRPIPSKVRQTMLECGSAILIFTRDQKFNDEAGNEVWRPSENVVHELGAASFAYEDRVVIFKEVGITLPTNFSSIGYIEFEENGIEAKTAELLQELIGFGLVRITPTA